MAVSRQMTMCLYDADSALYQDSMRAINRPFEEAYGSVFHISGNIYISPKFWQQLKLQWVRAFIECKSGLSFITINYKSAL